MYEKNNLFFSFYFNIQYVFLLHMLALGIGPAGIIHFTLENQGSSTTYGDGLAEAVKPTKTVFKNMRL